ncbi:flagellar hook assembly protein FlgD [Aquicella lusitana]|uniref:Basal-body rod modification protein FlgD n=1 Tax=Aquicella lusitana TaxID=254246 RepID=A0A370G864_9COXI|nr:FlgD immunoglobulin-like domain containing protein [Aquicella lusitana]RDI39957.1 flagellar basal-body rod modification protein FlgD [Aquicella lusitana]VVC74560.1 Basal-body rod modification protein FlgD [Aquicella lusitana]
MTTINNVNNLNNETLGANKGYASGKKELTPDDFITLFLKQLTSQNPLHPADSSTILQQMADISSISASKDTQKTLKEVQQNINYSLATTQLLTATQMIGKKVEVPSGISPLTKEEGLSGSVMLPAAATDIKVTIKDEAGKVVKELTLEPAKTGGLVEFKWDGLKDDGTMYDPGYYQISAKAVIDGKETPINTAGAFKIKSVATNQMTGELILNVDGLGGLGLNDIIKIL